MTLRIHTRYCFCDLKVTQNLYNCTFINILNVTLGVVSIRDLEFVLRFCKKVVTKIGDEIQNRPSRKIAPFPKLLL